jgi:hypothetical protein
MIVVRHSVAVAVTISETGPRRAIEIGTYRLRYLHQCVDSQAHTCKQESQMLV